jgi:transposase-like protein
MNIKRSKPGRQSKYEPALRRKVCEELLTGRITVNELRTKYQIPGNGTVYRWLKQYQQDQTELLSLLPMANSPEQNDNGEKSNEELRRELELSKAKIATLETMIDIAEEQFKIEIRKKSGTKPS